MTPIQSVTFRSWICKIADITSLFGKSPCVSGVHLTKGFTSYHKIREFFLCSQANSKTWKRSIHDVHNKWYHLIAVNRLTKWIWFVRKKMINLVIPYLKQHFHHIWRVEFSGIILCMLSTNERRHNSITPFLVGWSHLQNDNFFLGTWSPLASFTNMN